MIIFSAKLFFSNTLEKDFPPWFNIHVFTPVYFIIYNPEIIDNLGLPWIDTKLVYHL